MPTPPNEIQSHSWSVRILLISLAGILFLTLFPFHFSLHAKGDEGLFPFFHGSMGKGYDPLDVFLNVLLFVPFGFGLSEKLREQGKSRAATAASALAVGALFSYAIEVLQIYIPSRDSGWADVIANASGSVAGFFVYDSWGKWLLRILGGAESALGSFLRPRRAAIFLLVYFGIWFAASYRLQTMTRLRGWDLNPILVLGNDTWTRPWLAWKGRVLRLEVWDSALPDAAALALTAGGKAGAGTLSPIAAYNLSPSSAEQDSMNFLPPLAWRPALAPQDDAARLALQGDAWLVSEAPVPNLVTQLEKTGQFSMRIVCLPGDLSESDGRILSIGRPAAPADLTLRQQQSNLIFWFHNPLSASHAQLAWAVPNVFAAGEARDILYAYDGSDLSLFIDGRKGARPYRLGPGPALARLIRRIKPAELEGYTDIYYALIFFPAGIVLGLAARRLGSAPGSRAGTPADGLLLGVLLIAPPCLLEIFLVRASGRPFLAGRAVLALALVVAGALWINAERSPSSGPSGAEKA